MSPTKNKPEFCPFSAPYHHQGMAGQPQCAGTASASYASPAVDSGSPPGLGVWRRNIRPWNDQGRITSTEHTEQMQHGQGQHPMDRWMTQSAADEPWNNVGHVQRPSKLATTTVGERAGSVGSSMRALRGSEGE